MGTNKVKVGERFVTWEEVEQMPYPDVESLMHRLADEIIEINAQINDAKGHAAEYGEYSDAVWYRKAETAKAFKDRFRQKLGAELKRRRKKRRPFADWFVEAAKKLLPRETVDDLFDEAKRLRSEADPDYGKGEGM
jgi:hypothetical protein